MVNHVLSASTYDKLKASADAAGGLCAGDTGDGNQPGCLLGQALFLDFGRAHADYGDFNSPVMAEILSAFGARDDYDSRNATSWRVANANNAAVHAVAERLGLTCVEWETRVPFDDVAQEMGLVRGSDVAH